MGFKFRAGSIFIFTFALLLFSCAKEQSSKKAPLVENGKLDLVGWDFKKDGAVKLEGDWTFWWKKKISPEVFLNPEELPPNDGYFKQPGRWNGQKSPQDENEVLDGNGFATYYLKADLGNLYQDLAIISPSGYTAFELYIKSSDDQKFRLLLSNGIPGTTRETTIPQYLDVESERLRMKGLTEFVFIVSNFHHNSGGTTVPISISDYDAMVEDVFFTRFVDSALIGLLLIMGLYHFGLFLQRREDKPSLFFAFLCFDLAIRRILITGFFTFLNKEPSYESWYLLIRLEYITVYLGIVFFGGFFSFLVPGKWFSLVFRTIAMISVAFTLMTFVSEVWVFTNLMNYYQLIILCVLVCAFLHLILEAIRKNKVALYALLGFLPQIIAVVNDILLTQGLIQSVFLTTYGFAAFILAQSYILSKLFSDAYRTAEHLSENLKSEVDKQTIELREKSEEMEKQKNIIAKQFDKIKEDVMVAADVMSAMLPESKFKNEQCDFNSFFMPADELAGDLYGMEVRDERLMFWLCDVTGHGVASSMVAGVVREAMAMCRLEALFTSDKPKPAEALNFVCDKVARSIKGKFFATMSLGVFDFKTSELTVSGAAHLKPIHFNGGKWRKDTFGKLRNGPLIGYHGDRVVEYTDYSYKLLPGDFLFFYTDGVNEASFDENSPQFGRRRIVKFLKEKYDAPTLLDDLMNEVIKFQQKEKLDDDVTMMTLKVL